MGSPKAEPEDQLDWRYLSWDNVNELEDINTQYHSLQDNGGTVPQTPKYANPFEWSAGYKMYLSILGFVANFSTTYAGGSYTSATDAMAEVWHVSRVAVLVGVTLYTVAFGLAPMLLAPFSELNGRRPVVVVSGVAFVVGVLFCAVTRLYVGMLLARVLVGIASSTYAVVIVGIVADIYTDARSRYISLSLFTSGAMFGTGFGPLISAFIVQNTHWRWLFGVLGIFCLAMVIVIVATFKETRGSVLLSRKAKALNRWYDAVESSLDSHVVQAEKGTPSRIRWKVKADEERQNIGQMMVISLTRPMWLLFTEPAIFFFSCWAGFAWSIMYAMLVVVPYTFQTVYGFDLQTSSAMFAAMCIATIIMTIVSRYHDGWAAYFVAKEKLDTPEGILYPVAVEAALLPVGLFWYGWGAQQGAHWIVPALGLGCATMGMFAVYLAVFAYLAGAYKEYASSANAAQSMVRNLMGGAFPLFSQVMFQRLGFGGACSLLGGLGIVLTFVPWTLIFYGPKIRAKSKFAFRGDSS